MAQAVTFRTFGAENRVLTQTLKDRAKFIPSLRDQKQHILKHFCANNLAAYDCWGARSSLFSNTSPIAS
jgi:hypothetical protein